MKKLFDVKLTFDPADVKDIEVESVAVKGEFLFYESGLTGHTDETGMVDCEKKYPPSEYREGLYSIGGLYVEEMEKNKDSKMWDNVSTDKVNGKTAFSHYHDDETAKKVALHMGGACAPPTDNRQQTTKRQRKRKKRFSLKDLKKPLSWPMKTWNSIKRDLMK